MWASWSLRRAPKPAPDPASAAVAELDFDTLYTNHAAFVWTNARRLGVPPANLDDVVQDVFLVVHLRLREFDGRSSTKTWVCGILMNVVREHRRRFRRKEGNVAPGSVPDVAGAGGAPDEHAATTQALRLVQAILDGMPDEKREVVILSQLEGMSVPEIAEATGDNQNTIYARLRSARKEFDEAYERACEFAGRGR